MKTLTDEHPAKTENKTTHTNNDDDWTFHSSDASMPMQKRDVMIDGILIIDTEIGTSSTGEGGKAAVLEAAVSTIVWRQGKSLTASPPKLQEEKKQTGDQMQHEQS